MDNREIINKVVSFDDILSSIRSFRKYQKENKVNYEELEAKRIQEIKDYGFSEREENKYIKETKGLYLKQEKRVALEFLTMFLSGEIRQNQIKLENIFDFVNEKLDILDKQFGYGFDGEDKHNISLNMLQVLFANIDGYSQLINSQEEKEKHEKVLAERKRIAEENKKINRAFGRKSKVEEEKD